MSLEYFALKLRVSHVSKTLLILACSIPPFLLFKCQRELPLHPLSLPLSFSLLCSHFHFHCTMLFISYLGQTLLIFACSLPPSLLFKCQQGFPLLLTYGKLTITFTFLCALTFTFTAPCFSSHIWARMPGF